MSATATIPLPSRRSSDLSKNAPEVFAAAEEHPIEVTRRDGESLVLMSKREADSRAQLLQLAAQLIAVSLDDDGPLVQRMMIHFPWMGALSEKGREQCANEIIEAARASFSLQQPHLAIAEITSWRETASAIAAGLGETPVEWIEDSDGVVDGLDDEDNAAPSNLVERP